MIHANMIGPIVLGGVRGPNWLVPLVPGANIKNKKPKRGMSIKNENQPDLSMSWQRWIVNKTKSTMMAM